ncbi:MAG: DMT family transporter [Lachnospiraceae bacterium]|nr:DMT family transporter [Lachnospiraceae bacterium]
MKQKTSSVLLILAAGCMWGCMGLLVRPLTTIGLDTMEICFLRALITFLTMLAGLLIADRSAFSIHLKDIWCFIGTGAFSVTFFNFCYFKTITLTSLSVAAVLLYMSPAFVMIMSFFLFKEKITKVKIAALFIAFTGCVLVSGIGTGGDLNAAGILTGLGAGFGYALYSIFGRYALQRGYHSMTITFYTFLFATLATVFFVDVPDIADKISAAPMTGVYGGFMILFVTLFPYLCYTKGLSGLENTTASVIASIEPVVATVLGVIIYGETPNPITFLGIVCVLGSIVILNKKERKGLVIWKEK